MKSTLIMLAAIFTFIATYLFLALIMYLIVDNIPFRACIISPFIGIPMLFIGWIPAVIVGNDLDNYLK